MQGITQKAIYLALQFDPIKQSVDDVSILKVYYLKTL